MAGTLTRIAIVAVTLSAFASAVAGACQEPPPSQEEQARQTAEALLLLARSGWPQHPPFKDEIAVDSPNAAARLMWLNANAPAELLEAAGWMDAGTKLKAPEFKDAAHFTPERVRGLLTKNQEWIESLDAAVRLERFDLYQNCDPRAVPLPKGDPRLMFGFFRKAARVARADVIRLWESGDRDAAVGRVAIMVRLAIQMNKGCGTLIEPFVCESLLRMATESLETFANESPLSERAPSVRSDLRFALQAFDPKDANRGRQSWRKCADSMTKLAQQEVKPDEVGFELEVRLAELRAIKVTWGAILDGALRKGGVDLEHVTPSQRRDMMRQAIKESSEANPAALNAAVAKLVPLRQMIETAWDADDSVARFKEIGAEIDADKTQLLAMVYTPSPRHYHQTWAKANASVERMGKLLEPVERQP